MLLFTDEGFIIRRFPFGEGDVVLVVFSKNHGKLRLVAKGVRKISSRRSGHLTLFNQVEFQARQGNELSIISEVRTLNSYDALKSDTDVSRYVYYLAELLDVFTQEEEKHYSLYKQLLTALELLSNTQSAADAYSVVENFEIVLLKEMGFWSDDVQGRELQGEQGKRSEYLKSYIQSLTGKRINSLRVL